MNKPITYKDAGVNIDAAETLIDRIKPLAKMTKRKEVLDDLGGFGALFQMPKGYQNPILVSSTDGVGTKLKLATSLNDHKTIGIDLVAMCVNDIIVQGAEPLFFLDYYATGPLQVALAADVIQGIADGCKLAGCALIGGETAEMPGLYSGQDYDIAGFCVGMVEKDNILGGHRVKANDAIIGIASSGVHSNGFSLIRKILELNAVKLNTPFADSTLGKTLLTPTRIYVKPLLTLLKEISVHALAHITGGGLLENIPRVLREKTQAVIDSNAWERPEIFNWIQAQGNIANQEMLRTFNCGIGMVVIVEEKDVIKTMQLLQKAGEQVWKIGHVESTSDTKPKVVINE